MGVCVCVKGYLRVTGSDDIISLFVSNCAQDFSATWLTLSEYLFVSSPIPDVMENESDNTAL